MSKTLTKEIIINALQKEIDIKIDDIKINIEHLKNSLNSETKSSMGDKYETSRSMIQSELENYSQQNLIQQRNKNVLNSIERTAKNEISDFGSLIQTSKGLYFLGLGMGKVNIKSQDVYCISLSSPIGKLFIGTRISDVVNFNGEDIKIISIK